MTLKSMVNVPNTAVDDVSVGTKKLISEIQGEVYGHINALYRLQAQATEPTGQETNNVWLDTSGATPVLKYYDGAAFQQLGASGLFLSTISLDDGMKNFSRGVILVRGGSTDSLKVQYDAAAPPTIHIGGYLLQLQADTADLDFSPASAGWYDIYAKKSDTKFTIHRGSVNTAFTPGSDERVIGRVGWSGPGGTFNWLKSSETSNMIYQSPEGYFYASILGSAKQSIPNIAAWPATGFPVETNDTTVLIFPELVEDCTQTAYAVANGIFTAPRRGFYEFHASVFFSGANADPAFSTDPYTGGKILGALYIARDGDVSDVRSARVIKEGRGRLDLQLTCTMPLQANQTVKVICKQANENDVAISVGDNKRSVVHFSGRYLGTD